MKGLTVGFSVLLMVAMSSCNKRDKEIKEIDDDDGGGQHSENQPGAHRGAANENEN